MSIRETLWLWFYGGEIPPDTLTATEVIISILIAVTLCFILYLLCKRLFFLVTNGYIKARPSRTLSWFFAIVFAATWVIGSLEPFGYQSFSIMLFSVVILLVVTTIYLISKKY